MLHVRFSSLHPRQGCFASAGGPWLPRCPSTSLHGPALSSCQAATLSPPQQLAWQPSLQSSSRERGGSISTPPPPTKIYVPPRELRGPQHPRQPATMPPEEGEGEEEEGLDEREKARRTKISQANSGKVPWNKGRKHSPETIAKIRARSIEAMQRPEVAERLRASLQARQQVHSPETRALISAKLKARNAAKRIEMGLPPLEEKKPSRRKKAPEGEGGEGTEGEGGDSSEPKVKKPRVRKPKPTVNEDGTPKVPKKRTKNSEEHKKAIAESIRLKWQDPEFRELMVQKMREAKAAKYGTEVKQGPVRVKTPRPRPPSAKKKEQEWLQQIQTLVDRLVISRKFLTQLDDNIGKMKLEGPAFVNDPIMSAKVEKLLSEVQQRRGELVASMEALRSKIPPNVAFDEVTGKVEKIVEKKVKTPGDGSKEPAKRGKRNAAKLVEVHPADALPEIKSTQKRRSTTVKTQGWGLPTKGGRAGKSGP